MDYHETMKCFKKTMNKVTAKNSGGCTPIKDMLSFNDLKEDMTCFWCDGENDNCKFIVFAVHNKQ